MIEAKLRGIDALTQRLTAKARLLALAHGERQLRRQADAASPWREPRLVWPLFARDRDGS